MSKLKFAFFDASETLIRSKPPFTIYCIDFLNSRGIAVQSESISIAEKKANGIYQTHKNFLPRLYTSAIAESSVWAHYFAELLSCLASDKPPDTDWLQWGYLVNNFFEQSENWEIYDDVLETLIHLRNIQLRLGIISDFGDKLPNHLAKLQLISYFEIILVSSLCNICKNDGPNIYRKAAEIALAHPSSCVMIGDSYESDIVPAHEAGFKTVLLNRGNKRYVTPDNELSISSLFELPKIISNRLV